MSIACQVDALPVARPRVQKNMAKGNASFSSFAEVASPVFFNLPSVFELYIFDLPIERPVGHLSKVTIAYKLVKP